MGVDVRARFRYGYKVDFNDIPDAEERMDEEFSDIADEPDGWKVTIHGNEYWCSEVAMGDSAYAPYEDQKWYIGVDLPDDVTIDELADACHNDLEPTVREMYALVMRRDPTEAPRVHAFAEWC